MKVSLKKASQLLQSGEVVAVPTETVYGLAASIYQTDAIKKVFHLKNRPANNPLIIHLASPLEIAAYVTSLPPYYKELTEIFWPGPLTLVLPIDEITIPPIIRAGLSTAAFRVPNHVMAQNLLSLTGPLVMPSANLSGKPSSTESKHIENDFGKDFPILEGNPSHYGIESTILIFNKTHWEIGRLGAISAEEIEKILHYIPLITGKKDSSPICPGQLFRHYAPNANLNLTSSQPSSEEAILGFNDRDYGKNHKLFLLGNSKNPLEVAHNLYKILRKFDEEKISYVWVDMNFPHEGLWVSIRERLEKAASKV